MTLRNRLERREPLLLDGAMGTMLTQAGLAPGELPELFSIQHPDRVEQIHRRYLDSGAQILYANTFGANAHKLAGSGYAVREVIQASVQAAKAAVAGREAYVALDIGPLGELLEPAGALLFEAAYDLFAEMVDAGVAAGVDAIVIETITDLYEAKAAVLAAKEHSDLPVLVSMSFEEDGRTFTGCSVEAMALTLTGLGVDAIGINCSLGPRQIAPLLRTLARWTDLPLLVKPNAGLPHPEDGRYTLRPETFAEDMLAIYDAGATLLGGCCGTTPEFIAALKARTAGRTPGRLTPVPHAAVCTPTRVVVIDSPRIIGERINPTGKKLLKQALRDGRDDLVLSEAVKQAESGADLLDVNVGTPGIDEKATLMRLVKRIQSVTDLPLQLDSAHPEVLEAALRVYNGKPIVNSVNASRESLDAVLPLVKKYGAAVVGLTLSEAGIPPKAEDRLALAEQILKEALAIGIPREDVYIDCLTLTASAQQAEVMETLRCLRLVKDVLGLKTVLGVSNVSFGLPGRELINQSFLLMALHAGLDLPILNPSAEAMMDALSVYRVLTNEDTNATQYIARQQAKQPTDKPKETATETRTLAHAILRGLADDAAAQTRTMLETMNAMDIIDGHLIPALDILGKKFERGEAFLPQLLQGAQAAQAAFEVIKSRMGPGDAQVEKGCIVLATVKGDVHDIGKNIVKVLLDNYGYRVIDLGRDVPPEAVVEAARTHNAGLVGLSALMTTTLPSMEKTIQALREAGLTARVMVGGAVLTADYARTIGADYYARDAKSGVDIAREVFGR